MKNSRVCDTIHICSFCACTQKKITDVHAYPDETDSWLFNKLLRYLNVATVIHRWCVIGALTLFRQNAPK